jgi:hypothetical protein
MEGVNYRRIEGGPCGLHITKLGEESTAGALILGNTPAEGTFGRLLSPGEWYLVLGGANNDDNKDNANLRIEGTMRIWPKRTLSREAEVFRSYK